MKIPQSVRELLPKAPLAHLTTLNSDGSPQVTEFLTLLPNHSRTADEEAHK
jgi:predicted pyridoxine 5'-phosphate oxidase superfamily flavin-nucleotide-binding protein